MPYIFNPFTNNLDAVDSTSGFISGTVTQFDVVVGAAGNTVTSVGPGSAGQLFQSNGNASNPGYTTATYPSTATGGSAGSGTVLIANGTNWVASAASYPNGVTADNLIYASSTNVVGQLSTVNSSVLTTGTGGVPTWIPITDGQLVIGSTSSNPAAANLTAGTGISIVNASNSITINSSGSGLTWSVVTGTTQAASVNHGYIANNAGQVVITLPASSAVGDALAVVGINNATGWSIAQNSGQEIFMLSSATTAGITGSLTSSSSRDSVEMICVIANVGWLVINSMGNITVV